MYTKYFAERSTVSQVEDSPELSASALRARYRALFAELSAVGINTFVTPKHSADPGADSQPFLAYDPDYTGLRIFLDEARRAGVGAIQRADPDDKPSWALRHPANVAVMVSDEPAVDADLGRLRATYADVKSQRPDLPVITATVGELLRPGSTEASSTWPVRFWDAMDAEIRFVRYYPFRAGDDLRSRTSPVKPRSAPRDFFPFVESVSTTPYWYIPQAFGDPDGGSFDLPSPAELSGLSHLALAHGARGLIAYELFPDGNPSIRAMYDPASARPEPNGLIEAYATIASAVRSNNDLMLVHEPAPQLSVSVDQPDVMAVPRWDPRTGAMYLYLVNLDTNADVTVTATVTIPAPATLSVAVVDVFTADSVVVDGERLSTRLAPGQGRFLRLTS